MGAQSAAPSNLNYDPYARPDEAPVLRFRLDPFFLSKFEMTQGQWKRFLGKNPSMYGPDFGSLGGKRVDLLHPVEQVSWNDCHQTLARLGLVLPTEAQWEYGARGGTSSVWWTGDEAVSLRGADNLADRFFKENIGPSDWEFEDWLDDGYVVHAPIGSFAPNPYGLHDVHGNVSEWCRERYVSYELKVRPGDGERLTDGVVVQGPEREWRMLRGSDSWGLATAARSAARYYNTPDSRQNGYGVRPARSLSAP
jgi:formylglycine-generating enzyme required for sulfatase activity